MITMDRTWNSSALQERRSTGGETGGVGDVAEDDDERIRQQFLMGLLERSTSAPPPSGLATGSRTLFGADDGISKASGEGGVLGSGNSLFGTGGRSSVPPGDFLLGSKHPDHGAVTLPNSSSSPSLQQLDKLDFDDVGRRPNDIGEGGGAIIGDYLDRPKSAAPELSYGGVGSSSSRRPPPGLGALRSTSAAPPTTAGGSSSGGGGSGALLFESGYRAGPPRPSSTGVIGQQSQNASSSVMSSLGLISAPAPVSSAAAASAAGQNQRSIMDLIREDSPKAESPASLRGQQRHQRGHGQQDTSPPLAGIQTHSEVRFGRENIGVRGPHDGMPRSNVPQYAPVPAPQLDQQPLGAAPHSPAGMNVYSQQGNLQHGSIYPGASQDHQARSQQTAYGSSSSGHHAHPHPMQHQPPPHQSSYEAQTIYYSTQQQGRSGPPPVEGTQVQHQVQPPMQAQMIPTAPPGGHQAVYVNTPYGYATVQYHTGPPPISHDPHAQPRQVLHSPHIGPGGHPIPQEYIVPIQPTIPAGGTYAYWQQGNEMAALAAPGVPAPTTMTVLNAHGQPTTITVAGVAAASAVPLAVPQAVGGRHGRASKSSGGGKSVERGTPGRGKRGVAAPGSGGGRRGADQGKSPGGSSSVLLDEFRAAKTRNWVIQDIQGHVVEFCQDQNGSRFIQQRLEVAGTQEKELVMAEVLPSVRLLRNDVFGNYVVQKLLEHGTSKMRLEIKETLEGEMLALSVQMYGCRVVQKALETLDDDLLPALLTEFHSSVQSCIHDQNGNHVIQKCIEVMCSKAKAAAAVGDSEMSRFMTDQIQFIIDDVLESVAPLSCHPYGCRVLQRILEHCTEQQKLRALDEIGKCHRTLLDDQYGNYVIQHVLQFGRPNDRDSILQIIVESGLLSLSRQKFASNVVEKLLKYGSPSQRNAVVREMLKKVPDENVNEGEGGSSVVLLMVRDAYANYVVQTTLDVLSEGEERRLLLEELNKHSAQLRNYTFAKHIVAKLST